MTPSIACAIVALERLPALPLLTCMRIRSVKSVLATLPNCSAVEVGFSIVSSCVVVSSASAVAMALSSALTAAGGVGFATVE